MTSCVSLWREQPVIEVAYMSSRTFQGILRQLAKSFVQSAVGIVWQVFGRVSIWTGVIVICSVCLDSCQAFSLFWYITGCNICKEIWNAWVGDGSKRQGRPMRWHNLTAIYTYCELYVEVHLNRKFRGRHCLTWLQFSIFVLWWDIRWNVKVVICP